jgi:hypothetical protein
MYRRRGKMLDQLQARHHFTMQLADLLQQRSHVHRRDIEIEPGAAVDQPRGVEQVLDQLRHAQDGAANLSSTLADLGGCDGVLGLVEPPGMAVDDRHRRAEFVRGHRDEIPLQQGKSLLVR